ncbi:hypothetical protein H0H87_004759 [Tephrocybe sp. NHM501043]|nr:hypothetical protein H0H87_004759 [Tephrocybe sp. NHM501043]
MATPSSSATSPSPPMTFISHPSGQPQPSTSSYSDPGDKEQRQRAVQKFMARAEISTITRALRTRLSYASYKAAHNIHHVPLRDLEAHSQSQSQTASFSRTIAAKRKATGNSNNYYNNPATQSPHGANAGPSSLRRGGSGSMLPPSTTSSPRTYYPAVNGSAYATTSNNDPGAMSRPANPNQSLYTSILAPPPTKQARTIHNATDPPVAASSRPLASPRARAPKRNTADLGRSQTKSRKLDHGISPQSSRKVKRSPADKGKRKQHGTDADTDAGGDVDMKAAATLTSLLMHHRPSTGSASSPRSSIDGSEAGSNYSYSHFAQSSARTITAASPPAPVSAAASTSTAAEASVRNQTPPPSAPAPAPALDAEKATTPRPAPTDSEAANLMLFLATSPSPVRPTNKDSRDLAAYRALGGGPPGVLRDKGRVLFAPGSSAEPSDISKATVLARSGDASFTSSISSIGGELGSGPSPESSSPAPSQLLPPPSLPSHKPIGSPASHITRNDSPRPTYPQGPADFNFNDFIHGSPSPSRGPVVPAPKANLGLRADVGRKLFEEEQMRHALGGVQSPGKRPERALGAGFDLVQS